MTKYAKKAEYKTNFSFKGRLKAREASFATSFPFSTKFYVKFRYYFSNLNVDPFTTTVYTPGLSRSVLIVV
jgi:hypothetical protein